MWRGSSELPFVDGAVIARRYRLLRRIGEGSMSAVWHARDETSGADVALKLLVRPDRMLRARLLREAHASSVLRHANIARILDVGETGSGDPFIVTELLYGETLADLLARTRVLDVQRAAAIGRDIARALDAAHGVGIVHRDLRPANVFLHQRPAETAQGVKVLDFGMARDLFAFGDARGEGRTGGRSGAASSCFAPGSLMYASPEQVTGDAVIDGRSDIWSLGAVLFEMLAGVRPFDERADDVLERIASGRIPLLWHKVRNIHPGLSGLVMACLRRDRDERPWPASEIARRLDHFARPPRAPSWFPPPPSPRDSRPSVRSAGREPVSSQSTSGRKEALSSHAAPPRDCLFPPSASGRREALFLVPPARPGAAAGPDTEDGPARTTLPSAVPAPVERAQLAPIPWGTSRASGSWPLVRVPATRRALVRAGLAAAAVMTVLALAAAVYAAIFGTLPPGTGRTEPGPAPAAPGPDVPAGLDSPHH